MATLLLDLIVIETLRFLCLNERKVSLVAISLCQRLGLTRSVRNKPRARSASIECRRRKSPPEAKDERSESFAGGARGFAKLSSLYHEGAKTNKKLSLDKRLRRHLRSHLAMQRLSSEATTSCPNAPALPEHD